MERKPFVKEWNSVPLPDPKNLIKNSYREFLQHDKEPHLRKNIGLESAFNSTFPLIADNGEEIRLLDFVSYRLGNPSDTVIPLQVTFRLTIWKDQNLLKISEEKLDFGTLPVLRPEGYFWINGVTKTIIGQLIRAPGSYLWRDELQILPEKGSWLTINRDRRGRILFRLKSKKFPITQFFRASGWTPEKILQEFYPVMNLKRKENGWETKDLPLGILPFDLISSSTHKVLASKETPVSQVEQYRGQKFLISDRDLLGLTLGQEVVRETRNYPAGIEIKDHHLTGLREQKNLKILLWQENPEIYLTLKSDRYAVQPAIEKFVEQLNAVNDYSLGTTGRKRLNKRTGLRTQSLSLQPEDLVALYPLYQKYLNKELEADEIDHLENRQVVLVGKQVALQFQQALEKAAPTIKEKLKNLEGAALTPAGVVDIRPVINSVRQFFNHSGFSQYLEQTNPLSVLTHQRRVSSLNPSSSGKGGAKARDVHPSQYGRICPIETPEGGNIGLVSSPTAWAGINKHGQFTATYWKVKKGRITNKKLILTAGKEKEYTIVAADSPRDSEGYLTSPHLVARKNGDLVQTTPKEVDLIDLVPEQAISLSTALIPFVANDDANRALMGSNMQRQAVPLLNPQAPLVGTGMEGPIAKGSGELVIAENSGEVIQVDALRIAIRSRKKIDHYPLQKFQKTNSGTWKNQKPLVKTGDLVKKGQVIADGTATENGELALGQNVLVAFMPWYGYNFEDSILVSEKIAHEGKFTSLHLEEYQVPIQETNYGMQEISRDIPNVSKRSLRHLDETGIAFIGAKVQEGDIIVGRVSPKEDTPENNEEQLLRLIFSNSAAPVKDQSLRVPPGSSGTVIDVEVIEKPSEDPNERAELIERNRYLEIKRELEKEYQIIEKDLRFNLYKLYGGYRMISGPLSGQRLTKERFLRISVDELRRVSIRDEIRNENAKGLWERYDIYAAHLERERKRRETLIKQNVDFPPGVLKYVKVTLAVKRKLTPGDKMAGRHGNKGVISRIVPVEDMPFLEDGTPVDIVLNPLGVPSRMNIGQILETHLGWAIKDQGKVAVSAFTGDVESQLNKLLKKSGKDLSGQTVLTDGRTGEKMERPITVGYMYMMKLNHLVEEKIHARSIGPYSAITQQPLRGKAAKGGQRLGEMEVWALEAYGAAHTLQEMLTIKSDDIFGRQKAYQSIVDGKAPEPSYYTESFKILVSELKALGMSIKLPTEKSKRIKIRLASEEEIRSWSSGEVQRAETINYRTLKPEPNGLLCTKIFGPVKDYECFCGKYKKVKYENLTCNNCGTPVTVSRVRRERMGHIELAQPIVHTWFLKSPPYHLSMLLGIPNKKLEKISKYELWIVTDPGLTTCTAGELLDYSRLTKIQEEYGSENCIETITGGSAIKMLLENLDLEQLYEDLKSLENLNKKQIQRFKLVKNMIKSGVSPTNMVLNVLPILPADLRPLIPLSGGRFATSDLNDLYKKIINRNRRLARWIEMQAPDLVINRESYMLQEAVNGLFDSQTQNNPQMTYQRPLKALGAQLKGKKGRFRQNLLGKRVDYSGRSVITVGPNLKLHQCGLPKKMALELFRPFVYSQLRIQGLATNKRAAKIWIEREDPKVWDILDNIVKEHPVLLNRAPTLHRLGIQAFEPLLIEEKAIQLHPLVCTAFNADFDGDQMAVHVPLSPIACEEARKLMLATNNILNPANGRPIITPSQDMVLGLYYLSLNSSNPKPVITCVDLNEATMLWHAKIRGLHDPIKIRTNSGIIDLTVGRALLAEIMPKDPKLDWEYLNKILSAKKIGELINHVYLTCDRHTTVQFIDDLMKLGFQISTISGISFSKDDLKIPGEKNRLLAETQNLVAELDQQYQFGMLPKQDYYNQVIEKWMKCSDEIADKMMEKMELDNSGYNSVYIMTDSGARGSPAQVRQLAGMRGLMAKPTGEIMTTPITSNFKEGLTALEYFNSTHGSRKGLVDTALKTSDSGYLTRRLVDVAQDIVISEKDCGTKEGLKVSDIVDSGEVMIGLAERLIGRTLLHPVKLKNKEFSAGSILTISQAKEIADSGIRQVHIKSILTCKAKQGVCAKCYGMDLAHGKPAVIGEAVGVIAAQSIGEPGTQLTLRTFHAGGAAQHKAKQSTLIADYNGILSLEGRTVQDKNKKTIVIDRNASLTILESDNNPLVTHQLPYGAVLTKYKGDVERGQVLATWDPFTRPVINESHGIITYRDLIEGVSLQKALDPTTGLEQTIVHDWRNQNPNLKPRLTLRNKKGAVVKLTSGVSARYPLPPGATISVAPKQEVYPGDVLAKLPVEATRSADITGGLLRIQDLFELRSVKESPAVFAYEGGQVKIGNRTKNQIPLEIITDSGNTHRYSIEESQTILVQNGEKVKAGDMLVDGEAELQDMLAIFGLEKLISYLLHEVQKIYRLQGIEINDKHIEIIINQMLRKVKITEPGETEFIPGEVVDKYEFNQVNKKLEVPADAIPVIQGITESSLQTRSFISAAAFQETIKVLSEASLTGRTDRLKGPKENIIAGRLTPLGTGFNPRFTEEHQNRRR